MQRPSNGRLPPHPRTHRRRNRGLDPKRQILTRPSLILHRSLPASVEPRTVDGECTRIVRSTAKTSPRRPGLVGRCFNPPPHPETRQCEMIPLCECLRMQIPRLLEIRSPLPPHAWREKKSKDTLPFRKNNKSAGPGPGSPLSWPAKVGNKLFGQCAW